MLSNTPSRGNYDSKKTSLVHWCPFADKNLMQATQFSDLLACYLAVRSENHHGS